MNDSYSEINKEKQTKVLKIVSSSFYKELVKYGINSSDIVSVSMNLLDYATENPDSGDTHKDLHDFKVSNVHNKWKTANELKLDGIKICPLKEDHISKVALWLKGKEIDQTFIGYFPKEADALKKYMLYTEGIKYFAIYNDDKFVGIIGGERINRNFKKLEMKKLIGDKKLRGKGFGKSATFLFLYYVFHILEYNKVFIHSMDTNIKNINLNSRFGFSLEGLLYKEVSVKGVYHDVIRMGLLKNKWQQFFEK